MPPAALRPAAFLDRDGVLNVRIPGDTYVTRPEELELLPHAIEGARTLHAAGYALVVITNQRGVSRGFLSPGDLERIHAKLADAFAAGGAPLLGIYACPHGNDDGCGCRKPAPGLILRAAEEHGLDLTASLLVGDSERDVEAARRAGVARRFLIPSDGDLREAVAEALGGA